MPNLKKVADPSLPPFRGFDIRGCVKVVWTGEKSWQNLRSERGGKGIGGVIV